MMSEGLSTTVGSWLWDSSSFALVIAGPDSGRAAFSASRRAEAAVL
jgi:hypothetical protein